MSAHDYTFASWFIVEDILVTIHTPHKAQVGPWSNPLPTHRITSPPSTAYIAKFNMEITVPIAS